jgi:hypothetical protein
MKVATAPIAQFAGVIFDKKESADGKSQIRKARV